MLIRIFIVLVMVASAYLMLARSPEWRPWWSQQMARLGWGTQTERNTQLENLQQELAAIKQQFAEFKVALQAEMEQPLTIESAPEEAPEMEDSHSEPWSAPAEMPEATAQLPLADTVPREELLKMAERMELRAMRYGE